MRRISLVLACALATTAFNVIVPATAAETCESVSAAIKAARTAGDLSRLESLHKLAKETTIGCSEKAIYCLGQSVALGHLAESYRRRDAGAKPEEIDDLLAKGHAFGAPWQLLAGRGQIRLARARSTHDGAIYEQAASDLQHALNAVMAEPVCGEFGEPKRPGVEDIKRLRRQASEAVLLATNFVPTPTRNGCGGIFLNMRSIGIVETPVPITFAFKEVRMTPGGEKAASTFLECILKEHYRKIVLSGHTDRVGSDEYNMDLSARRLATVRSYLVQGGFRGEIELRPMGKREPFAVDDRGGHIQDEIDQLDRRVELKDAAQ